MEVIDPASCIGILRRAKDDLNENCERYICIALLQIMRDEPSLHSAGEMIVSYVQTHCLYVGHGGSNLEFWLIEQLRLIESLPQGVYQMCRMAWIDKMIESLTTKGCLP